MSTIEELALLKEREDHVEFKRAAHNFPFSGGQKSDPKDRRHCVLGYIVALANEGGGRLVLGMEDHYPHEVSGSDFALGKTGELVDEIYKRLYIRVVIEELYDIKNRRVVVINAPSRPVGKALRFEGVPLMRVGESLREMDDAEYYRIISEGDCDFSAHICKGLSVADLDDEAVAEMRSLIHKKRQTPNILSVPLEQLLRDYRLLTNDGLTIAALLLLGKREKIKQCMPQCNVVVEYRLNHSQIRYSARQEFCEPIFTLINSVWNYINQPSSNPLLHIDALPQIIDIPAFNKETIREAVLNSIIHRSLQMLGDNLICQYPDSITISNPGGFPYGVNIGNIMTVVSSPRSRLMAEVIEKTGLIERSGQGVDIMYSNCISEGKRLPDFSLTDDYQVNLTLFAEIENPMLCLFIRDYQNSANPSEQLNAFDLLTLYHIKRHQTEQCIDASVERLKKFGLIEDNAFYKYVLSDAYYNTLSCVRAGTVSAKEVAGLLNAMRDEDSTNISAFANAFASTKTLKQTRTFIQKCCENGILVQEGKGKAPRYRLASELRNL